MKTNHVDRKKEKSLKDAKITQKPPKRVTRSQKNLDLLDQAIESMER